MSAIQPWQMNGLVIAVDPAGPGGDFTGIATICPICRTLYCETLEPGQEVVAVKRCEVCYPADTEVK